jgi:lipopolysaccharide biosynthesis protein
VDPRFAGNLLSYDAVVSDAIAKLRRGIPETTFPGVMVTFDNTARRQWIADVWYGSNPYTFRRWLAEAARAVAGREPQRRIVFINAWNEWAEGAVLEPSDRFGSTYLAAVRDVVLG